MKKYLPITFFMTLFVTSALAQKKTERTRACHVAGPSTYDAETIYNASKDVEKTSWLYTTVREVCNKLFYGVPLYDKIVLRQHKLKDVAVAYAKTTNDNKNALYILLNDSIPYAGYSMPPGNGKPSLLIYMLAHEITHYVSNDILVTESNRYNNFKSELHADKEAGRAIGLMTRENLSFFDEYLPRLLYNSNDTMSLTHPLIAYRIMAAKAGWLEAKFTLENNNQQISINGEFYKKEFNDNAGVLLIGKSNSTYDTFTDFVYEIDIRGTKIFTYHKPSTNTGLKVEYSSGKGDIELVYLANIVNENRRTIYEQASWSDGRFFNGYVEPSIFYHSRIFSYARIGKYYDGNSVEYEGEMDFNYLPDGWGKKKYRNGFVLIGQWVNGELNGYGVSIIGDGSSTKGIWKNGKLIKQE